MSTVYSNPRMAATIEDWPSGSTLVRAVFEIEQDAKRGERATRYTVDPRTGRKSAVKKLTYAVKARIVDGDDGRTYLAMLTGFGFVSVMHGTMQYQHETVRRRGPRHAALLKLFDPEKA